MSARPRIFLALTLALATAPAARADEPVIEVRAHGARKPAATHALDPSASGSTLDLRQRVSLPRSLGDVVREAPGARVLSTGGMGAFGSLALRGAAAEETLVLLDEIPLASPDGGAFDLSLFPAELFGEVRVFRGGAPVWLGAGAIGGVLQLVPRRDPRGARLSLGAGSFGTWQAQGGSGVRLRAVDASAALVVRGTGGGFPYRDDRGTRFDASDDLTMRRGNADWLEASGLTDLTFRLGGGRLRVLALGVQRGGGFPGPGARPTPRIRRESSRALLAIAYAREIDDARGHTHRLQLLAGGAYGGDRFTDRYGQLGVSRVSATSDRSFRGTLRAAAELTPTGWLGATWVSTYAFDAYLPYDAYASPQPLASTRHAAASALEARLHGRLGGWAVELRPSGRLEWSRTALSPVATHGPSTYTPERSLLAPTARLGAVLAPRAWLALSASIATGTRLPTLAELFGDRALVLPAPDLAPVRSTSVDGGVSVRGARGGARGSAELRAFRQERRDAIAPFRTAQHQVVHENVRGTRQRGLEAGLRGELHRVLRLSGALTWLDARSASDKRLPMLPRWTAYVRPEGVLPLAGELWSSLSVAAELWHRSFAYVDRANLAFVGACTKVSASAALALFGGRVGLSARVDDLADARCTDLVGYPLPGRSLFFSLHYQETPP